MIGVIGPDQIERLPPAAAVRDLYLAAASEPPLNETAQVADLFAALYEATVDQESVYAAAAYEDDALVAFAYGTWLAEVGRLGRSGVWLQTTDIDSPARRLYEATAFTPIGHGPAAPNGEPGLVLFRPDTGRTVA